MPINTTTILYLFGGPQRLYMYDNSDQMEFLRRFEITLNLMINDLDDLKKRFDVDTIIRYYSTPNILNGLELLERYNYRINVSRDELESEKEEEEKEKEEEEEEEEEGGKKGGTGGQGGQGTPYILIE
jgi:hypothetical protein